MSGVARTVSREIQLTPNQVFAQSREIVQQSAQNFQSFQAILDRVNSNDPNINLFKEAITQLSQATVGVGSSLLANSEALFTLSEQQSNAIRDLEHENALKDERIRNLESQNQATERKLHQVESDYKELSIKVGIISKVALGTTSIVGGTLIFALGGPVGMVVGPVLGFSGLTAANCWEDSSDVDPKQDIPSWEINSVQSRCFYASENQIRDLIRKVREYKPTEEQIANYQQEHPGSNPNSARINLRSQYQARLEKELNAATKQAAHDHH
jgi:hypothetical protein